MVGPGFFSTIGEALQVAPTNREVTIIVLPGNYLERITLMPNSCVVLQAQSPGTAVVTWETNRPYESVLSAGSGARVLAQGLTFRHASKSVANNYVVFSQGAELTLIDCDVSSSTGAGVAAEGGSLLLRGGVIHDCARQGLVLLGPLLGGGPLVAKACNITVRKNGNYLGDGDAIRGPFDGVIARSGVEAQFRGVTVEDSGGVGIAVFEDSRIEVAGGALRGNRKGSSSLRNGGELVFADSISQAACV